MPSEITEQHELGTDIIAERRKRILDVLDKDDVSPPVDPGTRKNVSTTALDGDPGIGKNVSTTALDGDPGTGKNVSTIVALVGAPGTGKTWMARDICRIAIETGLCYETLWVSVSELYKTETMPEVKSKPKDDKTGTNSSTMSAHEESKTGTTDGGSGTEVYKTKTGLLEDAIARQILSQSSTAEEWEVENNVKKEEDKKTIDEMVQGKLNKKKPAQKEEKDDPSKLQGKKDALSKLKGKKEENKQAASPRKNEKKKEKYDLLLVLDESRIQKNESELWKIVWFNVRALLPSIKDDQLMTIITRRKLEDKAPVTKKIPGAGMETEVTLPLPEEIKFGLLSLDETIQLLNTSSDSQPHQDFLEKIARKSRGLPAAITMIAEAIARHDSVGLTLESASEKAAHYKIAAEHVNPLIHCAYTMLPTDILKFCFCHSIQFFSKYGGVHYIELITQWILEGYFDSFEHIKQKYQEGHAVLMELKDRHMLKVQEDNNVVAEGAALEMIDCLPGFLGTSRLGLAGVVNEEDQRIALGRITQIDGMIKTICDPKKWDEVSTLLIDGNRLCLEVDEGFLARMKHLHALAIFNSGLKSLDLSSKMEKKSGPEKLPMKLLVLRSCDLLNGIADIELLKTLTVLEISGANSIQNIPGRLLDEMTQLQSLNLSGCHMKLLPSLSKLINLHFLILRDCSSLQKLPRINELVHLETIDLSGATSLTFFPEQDLSKHQHLQTIDLSRTQIKRLPKFGYLKKLSRISIEGCKKVRIFPSLQNLDGLKILYLSEIEFRNFHEIKPRDSNIKSKPLFPVSLSELHLRDCPTLKCLPPIAGLKNLEVLDVSGASDSEFAISDISFRDLDYLRELNLSNTKLKKLPPLSNLHRLRKLFLKNCELLEKLPEMNGLENLEVLDLSGCSKLVEFPKLNDFPKLELLDISNTGIKVVPSEISETSSNLIPDEKHRQAYGVFNLAESLAKGKKPLILVNDGEIFQSSTANKADPSEISATSSNVVPDKKHRQAYGDFNLAESKAKGKMPWVLVKDGGNSPLNAGMLVDPSRISALKSANEVTDKRRGQANGVFTQAEIQAKGKPSILVNDGEIFQSLEKNPELKEVCKKKISIPLSPSNEQATEGVMFSDFYLWGKSKDAAKFLEIRGLESICHGLKEILNNTEYISWVDPKSKDPKPMKSLSDLDAGCLSKMKGCWIARCIEMESIFGEEKDIELVQNLEILWVSNLPKVERLFNQKLQSMKNLENLKQLHIDCCPKLKYVFTSPHQIPKRLEVLEIKFCDSLETVYKHSEDEQDECALSNLKKLFLFKLPELTSLGFKKPDAQIIKGCPNLP